MKLIELFESKSADLYHFMGYEKSEYVFTNDYMPARWKHKIMDIKGNVNTFSGNSFTRNKHAAMMNVRITVDQELLSHNHKIVPVDGQRAFYGPHSPSSRNLAAFKISLDEEFVIGPIKDLHRYIKAIEYRSEKKYGPRDEFSDAYPTKLYEICENYAKKFKIPFTSDIEKSKLVPDPNARLDSKPKPVVKMSKTKLHRNNPKHPLYKSDKYK